MKALEDELGVDVVSQHEWHWFSYASSAKDDEWVPQYTLVKNLRREDYWTEFKKGLNGCLSVEKLTKRWGCKWRSVGPCQRSEASRRSKLCSLVQRAERECGWDSARTFKWMDVHFPIGPRERSTTAGQFIRFISDKKLGGFEKVCEALTRSFQADLGCKELLAIFTDNTGYILDIVAL